MNLGIACLPPSARRRGTPGPRRNVLGALRRRVRRRSAYGGCVAGEANAPFVGFPMQVPVSIVKWVVVVAQLFLIHRPTILLLADLHVDPSATRWHPAVRG